MNPWRGYERSGGREGADRNYFLMEEEAPLRETRAERRYRVMMKKETRYRREACEGVHRANECRRDTRGRDTKKEIVLPKYKRDFETER